MSKDDEGNRPPALKADSALQPQPSPATVVTAERRAADATDVSISMNDGFFPSPKTLAEYHKIDPTLVGRSFDAMEKEQDHRQQMNRRGLFANVFSTTFGQLIAGGLGFGGLYVAYQVAAAGSPWAGTVIAALDLSTMVLAFVGAKKMRGESNSKEAPRRDETDRRPRGPTNVEVNASTRRVAESTTTSTTLPK